MLFNPNLIFNISTAFVKADMECRKRFHENKIVNENDYTSQLMLMIEIEMNKLNLPGLDLNIHSQVLPNGIEQKYGVDACIILTDKVKNKSKICLFEAKIIKKDWDYYQGKTKDSHFSLQLEKQKKIKNKYAIWEQFYNSDEVGNSDNGLSTYGSTCIWQNHAYEYKENYLNTTIWKLGDIYNLAKKDKKNDIGEFILLVCKCVEGKLLDGREVNRALIDIGLISNTLSISIEDEAIDTEGLLVNSI